MSNELPDPPYPADTKLEPMSRETLIGIVIAMGCPRDEAPREVDHFLNVWLPAHRGH